MKPLFTRIFLTLFGVLTIAVSGIHAKSAPKPILFERTLFANIQSINRTTGEVVISGVDTRGPTTPGLVITFKWGDGTSNNGFFPNTKIYTDRSKNYLAKVISTYPDGQKDSVSLLVNFVVPTLSTVAGPITTGDGASAILATVNSPEGVVIDVSGNTYFTEAQGHTIRKINTSGIITTIAGTTTGAGFSGDGGPATSAQLNYPTSLAIDGTGNLYFSDYNNNRIRKISTSGVITTVAGNGNYGFSGDGGQATAATFINPYGVLSDAGGTLYIADRGNNRVRKVSTTGVITTFAGTGTAGFAGDNGLATSAQLNGPTGVAIDGNGNIYIGDQTNFRIRKVTTSGIITTIAGTGTQGNSGDGGPATSAQISFFAAPKFDASGTLYFSDNNFNRIRKINTSTGTISLVAGGGSGDDGGAATSAQLAAPHGLFFDANGNLLIAERNSNRVRRINTAGIISTIAGPNNAGSTGDGGPATSARLNYPVDVKGDGNGNFYFTETSIGRIRKVNASGIITSVAGTTAAGYSGDNGPATSARLAIPYGVLPDVNGGFYIADTFNNRIRKVDAAGTITTFAGNGVNGFGGDNGPAASAQLKLPYNIALDKIGNLYIADTDNHRIRKVNSTGVITTFAGTGTGGFNGDGGSATSAQLNYPTGLAFDAADNLYVVDNRNNRIRRITPTGSITTVAGTGTFGFSGSNGPATNAQLASPFGVVVSTNGLLFISESGSARIRQIGLDGIISDVAGTNFRGFSGNNGPATDAQLGNPLGIGMDTYGNLLIADQSNVRIRKVACVDPPTVSLIASSTNVCTGDVVSLSAITITSASSNTFVWTGSTAINATSPGSATASPVQGVNTYSVVVTNAGGCTTKASITIQAGPLQTIKTGTWTDATVWSCGRIPTVSDTIRVGHLVTIPDNYTANSKKVTYISDGNLHFNTGSRLNTNP